MNLITRYAWEDRFPKHYTESQLRNAARDSVIRYARHFGLRFCWMQDMYGERWRAVESDSKGWPEFWMAGMVPTGIRGWQSTAEVIDD